MHKSTDARKGQRAYRQACAHYTTSARMTATRTRYDASDKAVPKRVRILYCFIFILFYFIFLLFPLHVTVSAVDVRVSKASQ